VKREGVKRDFVLLGWFLTFYVSRFKAKQCQPHVVPLNQIKVWGLTPRSFCHNKQRL